MNFSDLFREYLVIGMLPEKARKKFNLISRYKDKVSNRLKQEEVELSAEADRLFSELLYRELTTPSLFLKKIPTNSWVGAVMAVPFSIGETK